MRFGSALSELAALCRSSDPSARLDLPGAWVLPGEITFQVDATAVMEAEVYLVARDVGAVDSLDQLGDMLTALRASGIANAASPVSLDLPNHSSAGLPALRVVVPIQITEE